MLAQNLVVDGHRTGHRARRIIRCLTHAAQHHGISEIGMQPDGPWIANTARTLLGPRLAVGHMVNQTRVAILRHPRAQVSTQTPIDFFYIRERLVLRRKAAQENKASAIAQLVQHRT